MPDNLLLQETHRLSTTKIRTIPQPEGRQAKVVNRRTDYEWPVALQKFGGNQIPSLLMSDWAKKGVRVSRRFFGDFLCVQKVTRVRAGEARGPKPEAAALDAAKNRKQKRSSEEPSSDKPPAGGQPAEQS